MPCQLTSYYFMVLDIETSTLVNDEGDPTATWLSYGYCILYDRDGDTRERCYFREWSTLYDFYTRISQRFVGHRIICFVHNLSYEMDYLMKNLSKVKKFLTNSTHGFISAVLEDFPQIEFRCTVKLTLEKLEKIGEQVGLPKLESPYRTITPLDEPTEEEIIYCQRDCDIVAKYVVDVLLKEWGAFSKVPLTKTGRVRKTYNNFYAEYARDVPEVTWDLFPDEDCYDALNDAFAGGITISNPLFTGLLLKNVHSYDIKSSYPFAQLSEEYPYCIKREYNPTEDMLQEKFFIAKIRFNRIHTLYDWAWLSQSKMNAVSENAIWFNGKLIYAQSATRTITNVDYEMICKTYRFDSFEILEFYHMPLYGELPEPYINTIYHYSKAKYDMKKLSKTVTEDSPNYLEVQADYMRAKGDFNSIYGMSVQKILQEEYEIDDELFNWKPIKKRYIQSEKHMRRNFLFGVYVTAYARRNLLNAIITNCPNTFVYADTDSIKYIGRIDFQNTNKKLPPKHLACCYVAELGQFDDEGIYSQFVTFGAKKYAYSHDDSGRFYLTVAGLPKDTIDSNGGVYRDNKSIQNFSYDIHNFRRKTLFKDCKLGKKYITTKVTYDLDEEWEITNKKDVDEATITYLKAHKIDTKGGVALYPTSYLLDVTDGDYMYAKGLQAILPQWLEQNKLDGNDYTEFIDIRESLL